VCDFVANLWWPQLTTDIVHMSDHNRHREVAHSSALLQRTPWMNKRRAIQEAKNMGTRRFEREFNRFRRQCREHCRAGTFFDADAMKALERHEGPPMEQVLAVVTADSSLRSERPMACPQPKSMPRQSDVERAGTEAVNTTGTPPQPPIPAGGFDSGPGACVQLPDGELGTVLRWLPRRQCWGVEVLHDGAFVACRKDRPTKPQHLADATAAVTAVKDSELPPRLRRPLKKLQTGDLSHSAP